MTELEEQLIPWGCTALPKDLSRVERWAEELSEIQTRQMQGPAPGEGQPWAPRQAGGELLESSSEEKGLKVLVDNELALRRPIRTLQGTSVLHYCDCK